MLNRRKFFQSSSVGLLTLSKGFAQPSQSTAGPALSWFDVRAWGVEGRVWERDERLRYFDRFPAKAEKTVRKEVWNLSRDSAGMLVRFETDSPEIHVRYRLFRDRLAMSHMPATGVSGVDLYGLDSRGQWRWIAVSRPESQDVSVRLIAGLDSGRHSYSLYLPLYNGVEFLELGILKEADFKGIPPLDSKPLVFYGTSITHGACASRPGMPHPAILGRRLNRPVVNLGFSGNGRMEAEVGALLCELDPAVYIIDCLPNMKGEEVRERCIPLVQQLKQAHPRIPIVLVEDRSFTNSWILKERRDHHRTSREELEKAFTALREKGVDGLYYLKGVHLLGEDSEGATDGSHPSDLGFMRQADAFDPVIRRALSETGQ